MPPLRGIDRGLNGRALKALEESGHGRRLAIVDASYDIPAWAEVIDYTGQTSADALEGIGRLVPIEGGLDVMLPDPGDDSEHADDAEAAFFAARDRLGKVLRQALPINGLQRLDEADPGNPEDSGFYSLVNDESARTLFVRTRDVLPYACASFMIGHAQSVE